MKALIIRSPGSAKISFREIAAPTAGPGEVLVQMKSVGLNYADIMRMSGAYPLKHKGSYINGFEGAGIVIDASNSSFKPGDRVGFADVPFAHAEIVAVPVDHVIPLPEDISFETAAATLLQGLTAQYLTTDSYKLKADDTVLIHAAAGGVGQLLIQISKAAGARVIGLVSAADKREVALSLGADDVFLYHEDWAKKILEIVPDGVDVVYESVGSTMKMSLEVTRVRGHVVFFGLAGGRLDLGDPLLLIAHSKTITGGDLWNYLTSRKERLQRADLLFSWIRSGKVKIGTPTVFRLSDGQRAYRFMESRKSTGKILMNP